MLPGEAHPVHGDRVAQLDAHVHRGPRRAAQRFVEAAHLEGDALRDRLDVRDVGDPVVGIGRVDQAADPVADLDLAAAQIFLHGASHLDDRAAAFVAQRPHRIGVAGPPLRARLACTSDHLGPHPGAHADPAIVIPFRTANRSLMYLHQHLGWLEVG